MIEEPIRLEADPGTPSALRELLRGARADGLEAAAVARVGANVERAAEAGVGSTGTGLGSLRVWGVGLATSAVIVAAIVVGRDPAPQPSAPAPVIEAPSAPAPTTVEPPAAAPPQAPAIVTLDESVPEAPAASPKRNPTRSVPAEDESTTLVVPEAAMLLQARRALRRDARRTLALTDEHRTKFPGSQLAQERESLAILALVELGRRSEAESRAERFFEKFPASPHSAAIRRALAEGPASETDPAGDTQSP